MVIIESYLVGTKLAITLLRIFKSLVPDLFQNQDVILTDTVLK